MNTSKSATRAANRWKVHGWMVSCLAMVSFAAGALLAGARADNQRVFELLIIGEAAHTEA